MAQNTTNAMHKNGIAMIKSSFILSPLCENELSINPFLNFTF